MSRCGSCKLYWNNGCEGDLYIESCVYTLQDYICDILARAEAAEARVHELETTHRTEMCSDGYDCVQLRKARKAVADAEARAEKAEKERDAAVEDMRGICYLCANAKPYSEFSQRMMTCEHIKAVASTKSPGCKHFKWRGQKEE